MIKVTSRFQDPHHLFETALKKFVAKECDNIFNNVSERNLCGRLSLYLTHALQRAGLKGYYVDAEYNRKQDGKIKTIIDGEMNVVTINCDLIVHTRGEKILGDNFIAIEMKKSRRPMAEKISDRKRLIAMTQDPFDQVWPYDGTAHPEHVCGYLLGVYIILNVKSKTIALEYYRKGQLVNSGTLQIEDMH